MAGLNARSQSTSKSISAKPCPTGASVFFFPNGISMKQMRRRVALTSLLLDRYRRSPCIDRERQARRPPASPEDITPREWVAGRRNSIVAAYLQADKIKASGVAPAHRPPPSKARIVEPSPL